MLKKAIVLSLFLAFAVSAGAAPAPLRPAVPDDCGTPGKDGSPVNLSGTVNTYWTTPTGTLAAGATQMTVGAATGATGTFPSITAGDLLLVIQMQDAAINSANDERYGDSTGVAGSTAGDGSGSSDVGTANAGHYEYVQVTSVSPDPLPVGAGGTINFEGRNGVGLLRSYVNANSTAAVAQKRFQVIRVPQYDTVTMSNTTPVTCPAWDGTRGGIVVMDVRNTLDFNNGGSINVTGMGFRGGGAERQTGGSGLNTDYRTITQVGGGVGTKINGSKGEGYAGTPRLVFNKATNTVVNLTAGATNDIGYPNGSSGRGAPGNAGGGATDGDPGAMDDNAGGGGGGNGGKGGQGGNSGNSNVASGGFGGAVFPFTAGRVVLGGGGGAGCFKQPDVSQYGSGGPGGGIVLIRAFDVAANTGTVSANGDTGFIPSVFNDNGNGGGGGGAGGSIVFTVLSGNLSTLTLNANGGAGVNATAGATLLMGPGGGGSGGVILTNAAATMNTNPGAPGTTGGGAGVPVQNYGATAGATGARSGVGLVGFISPSDIPGVQSGAECGSISINDISVTEGNAGTSFATFTITNPGGTAATVNWSTADGTATDADNDYEPLLGQSVTFLAGETSKQIQVTINGDLNNESNETFTVTISTPTPGVKIGKGTGTCTITTDDAALSIGNRTAAETNGDVTFTFTVTLSSASASTITARVDTVDGTATAPGDYTAIVNGLVTFLPGETSKDVNVTVKGDTVGEAHESFTVVLSNPTNATIASGTGTGMIQNDDSVLSINSVSLVEGNAGTQTLTFTVALDFPHLNDVTVNYATQDVTAAAPGDYTAISSTQLTFTAGQTTKTIDVVVNGDTTPEAHETFQVLLSSPSNATIGTGTGTGTIQNDDAGISIADASIAEGDAGQTVLSFTVTLDFPTVNAVTVDFATADNTATTGDSDYAAASGQVSFAAGVTSQPVLVNINGDTKNEANETFFVNLTNPSNAAITDGQGLGTITNDDPVPSVSINDVAGAEGNAGTTSFIFTVTLSAASGQTVTVDYATANGTATSASGDYQAVTTTTLTFNPGETSKQVTVLVNGDTTPEAHETFTVGLTNPVNVAIGTGTGTGTIQNDESGISINDVTLAEGNSATTSFTFTATLDFPSVTTVSATFTAADGSATAADSDYQAITGTVTFAPGVTSQPVTVLVNGDTKNEANETFFVNLTSPTNGSLTDAQGLGTITNDDAVPSLSINDVSAAEGDSGTTAFTFTVTLAAVSGQTVTVDFATADGTATVADSDYAATNGTLSFAPGETAKTVTVNVTGDTKNEADEGFVVNLTNPGNASISDAQGAGTITNEDVLPVLSIDDVALNEGNSGTTAFTFTITLGAVSGQTVTVDFATAPGTALAGTDYASTNGTVSFAPGETTKTATVNVTGEFLDEANETFFVNLTNPSNATIADNQGQGTIQNDDSNPTISISNASVVEGNSGTATLTFTVTLSAASGQNVTVNFATADGTATLADNDYAANSGVVTFTPGQQSQQVTVTVNGDTNDEQTETVLVNLSGASGGTIGTAQGIGSIVTDDTPADLVLVKTVSNGFPSAGDTITYTLTISYTGPTDATNVTLVDKLPAGVTFTSASPSQGIFDDVSGVWTAGTVPIGGTASLSIQVTVNAGTWGQTIVNSATVGSDVQNDVNPTNNQSSVNIVVVVPELVIQFAGAATGVPGVDPTPVVLPSGTEGAFYQQQAFATGGLPQYHWSVVSSTPSFPFNLDPDTGVFSGTAAAGTYSFRLGVSDAQNPTASDVRDFTVTIAAPGGTPDINVLPAPPSGTVGTSYSHPFTAVGGQPPFTWSVSAGTLPTGLLLQPSTGIVFGTPSAAGTFNFTVTVTDSAAAVDNQAFSITIAPVPVTVVTTSLPPGSEGSIYSQQIEAEGGIGPGFTWSVTAGTIPPGTNLVGNSRIAVLSGTPVAAGTYVFTVQASDNSQVSVSDTQVLIVLVSASGTQPLITTSSIPEGTVTLSYSAQLTAAGGVTPYAWSLVAGVLPGGLTLNSATGVLSGVPTESGVFQIIVQVADSTTPPQFDTQELTLTVWTLPNIVTPSPLPNGLLNDPYSVTLSAVGGKPPLAWSLTGGGLPAAGLSFSPASGTVSGTPNTVTTVSFTARITDANGFFDEQPFQLAILDPSVLAIVTNSLQRGFVGIPYSRKIVAVGGATPYAWSSTPLPGGLTLDAATGMLTGTPTSAGNASITFTVIDDNGAQASRTIDLRIEALLAITTVKLPDGSPNTDYDTLLESTGGTNPTFWEIIDATIPPGLSLSASTGAITGLPPRPGTWTFLAQVTDEDGHTSQKLFTIVIRPFGRAKFNAGYCGLTGLEILIPLGALWLYRRRREGRRTLSTLLSAFVVFAILGAAPSFADEDRWLESHRTMSLQEPKAQEQEPPKPAAAPAAAQGEGEPFFQSFEAAVHLGMIAFSSKFEADPEFAAGLSLRAALPWFSKTVLSLDEPMVGMFIDFTFSKIDRDIAVLPDPDGTLIFFTIGLDLDAYKDETWLIRPQLGLQYGHFGGVSDLDNGIALLLGLEIGVSFAEHWRLFFNPQVGIGEDQVFFLPLGVAYSF